MNYKNRKKVEEKREEERVREKARLAVAEPSGCMIPTGERNAATLQIRPKGHQLPHPLYLHCGLSNLFLTLNLLFHHQDTHTQIYMFFCLFKCKFMSGFQ